MYMYSINVMYTTDPYYEKYLINKSNKQKESFNILNQRDIKFENSTIIFLNKSKYSESCKNFMKEMNKYMNTDIVIYFFHLDNEIKEFIKPFDLNLITYEHLDIVFEYFNDSNYNAINEHNIIIFLRTHNFKNKFFIYM